MTDEFEIDKRRVRAAFSRAAATYDAAAVLQQEVCRRMLERLDWVRLEPQQVLDIGCGTGEGAWALARRYGNASVTALDMALPMLAATRSRASFKDRLPWRRLPVMPVCADMEALPLSASVYDLVWSNFAIQWLTTPDVAFTEMRRVLKEGGLLMFSTFGPDTLKELRQIYAGIDGQPHVSRFIDMHDIGDALVRAGFANPVMDVEHIQLTYPDAVSVMRDLKSIGATNAAVGRTRGLSGRDRLEKVRTGYEAFRRDGVLPATFEVVYGHAWAAPAKPQAGDPIPVSFHKRRPA